MNFPATTMNPAPALFALFALGTPAGQTADAPITVTAHPWAPFISPMGEAFRAHFASDDTLAIWFGQADRNHDGRLTVDEMVADAERFFATLDTNHDDQIDPEELNQYEWRIAPEIQVNSRTRRLPGQPLPTGEQDAGGGNRREQRHERESEINSSLGLDGTLQGAARYSLLNIPEPVAAADANFDRAISLAEFRQAAIDRFNLLDSMHAGVITLAQLELLRQRLLEAAGKTRHHGRQDHDARLGSPVPGDPDR